MANVRELILHRGLSTGSKLPSSRDLSRQLAISRNTVINAYDRLISEGYLEVKGKAGIFVSEQIPETALSISTAAVDAENTRPAGPTPATKPTARTIVVSSDGGTVALSPMLQFT